MKRLTRSPEPPKLQVVLGASRLGFIVAQTLEVWWCLRGLWGGGGFGLRLEFSIFGFRVFGVQEFKV